MRKGFALLCVLLVSFGVVHPLETYDYNGIQKLLDNERSVSSKRLLSEDQPRPNVLALVRDLMNFIINFLGLGSRTSQDTVVTTESITIAPTGAQNLDFLVSEPTYTPIGFPSAAPSDIPSLAPSDIPSLAPSDIPSQAPSDIPSALPSDVPSSAPSDFPSVAPTGAILPDGYDSCPTSETIGYTDMTQVTVLYGYKFTARPGYLVSLITRQVEQAIQTELLEEVCVDSTGAGAFAISPEPDDIPSAYCDDASGSSTEGNSNKTSCHLVAVRTNLLIAADTPTEMADTYCKTIDTIQALISNGTLTTSIDGIETLEVYASSDIIPMFCSDSTSASKSNIDGNADSSNEADQKVETKSIPVGTTVGIVAAGAMCVALTALYVYLGIRRDSINYVSEVPSEAV